MSVVMPGNFWVIRVIPRLDVAFLKEKNDMFPLYPQNILHSALHRVGTQMERNA